MSRAVLALVGVLLASQAAGQVHDLGGMYTYHYHDGRYADWGDYALHGARIAIEEVNASGLLGDDRIRLKPENTVDYHCWPEHAAAIAETLMAKDILVMTGVDCSGPAVEIARVAERFGVPAISNGANASSLSSAEEFPWLVRVVTPSEAYEGHLIDVAARLGVDAIGYLYTTDAWGLGARRVIHDYADRRGIDVAMEFGFPRDTGYAEVEAHVRRLRDAGLKHIVMTGPTPDTVRVFRALHALDMNRPGHTFYASEMISADESAEAVMGSRGYFAPMTRLVDSTRLRAFRAALETRLGHAVDVNGKAFFYGALSHDHILAVAHAIAALHEAGEPVDRRNMMAALRRMDFEGATGRIRLVPGTNDRAEMPVQIFNSHGFKADGVTVDFVPVGAIAPVTGELELDEAAILLPGGRTLAPR